MHKYRDFSNRLNIEFSDIEIKLYNIITEDIISKFNLIKIDEAIFGITVITQDFKYYNSIISLEWENGYYNILAKNREAESIIIEIANYINKNNKNNKKDNL